MPVINFTPAFMATGLVCPPDKARIEYSVADEPGLFVECRASAKAVPTWYLRLKNAKGTNAYKRLGTVKEVSLTQARKTARTIKAEHVAAPKQPAEAAPAVGSMTLSTYMTDHLLPHAAAHKRSYARDEQLWRLRLKPRFGDLPLNKITRHDVQAFHISLVKEEKLSPASADLHASCLRHALAQAVQWDLLEKNPLAGFKLFHVDNRQENYLDQEEVERLKDLLLADSNRRVALLILFLLVSGARLSSAMNCKHRDVDVANGVWVVPASEAKSKRANPQYLNPSALWILEEVGTRGKSEFVFVNEETGKPYTTITRVWYRIRKKAGLSSKTRLHDLRHTFGKMVLEAGHSLEELRRALNHADARTTLRYSHLSARTMREVALAASVVIKPVPAQAASPGHDGAADTSSHAPQEAANAGSVNVPKVAAKAEAAETATAA